jgi:hypothetical protein
MNQQFRDRLFNVEHPFEISLEEQWPFVLNIWSIRDTRELKNGDNGPLTPASFSNTPSSTQITSQPYSFVILIFC